MNYISVSAAPRLILNDITPEVMPRLILNETSEQKRVRDWRELRSREKAARRREEVREQIKLGARKSLIFLLVAVAALTFFWHRYQFFDQAFTVVHHMSVTIKNTGNTSQLRRQTTSYENEINEITQADNQPAPAAE